MPDFFDFHDKLQKTQASEPVVSENVLTIAELSARIERALRREFPPPLRVRGEISNLRAPSQSGHLYFTLKDDDASIDAVIWRSDLSRLRFQPRDGMEVVATGRIALYAARGKYQIVINAMQPLGQGALELAFQQLREKLHKEGLFDPAKRLPLPRYPQRIVIVTSLQTAALQDVLKVLRRHPFLELQVYHVPVQGDEAAPRIASALRQVYRWGHADLVLLSRGGGSLEDLWPFNEEMVARAVADATIPVITGVGHEIDTTIADLAADYHAHTPTEAAQVAVQEWRKANDVVDQAGIGMRRKLRSLHEEARLRLRAIEQHSFFRNPADRVRMMQQRVEDRQRQLLYGVTQLLANRRRRLGELEQRLSARSPLHQLRLQKQRVEQLSQRLTQAIQVKVREAGKRVTAIESHLNAVSPKAVLERGYSITRLKKGGAILRNVGDVKKGTRIVTVLADGEVTSTTDDPQQPELF